MSILDKLKKEDKPEMVAKPKKKKASFRKTKLVPHLTEKAVDLQENGQYTFKVDRIANKYDIKRTVEEEYGVDVIKVQIVNVPKKKRRLGRTEGWRKGYKKAIVRVKGTINL